MVFLIVRSAIVAVMLVRCVLMVMDNMLQLVSVNVSIYAVAYVREHIYFIWCCTCNAWGQINISNFEG